MRYGSVCSGIEAATVAWHPLGWRPHFFSEIEAFPRSVLTHHYPTVPLHGDFTTIHDGDYEPIDLLVGGTPCQDFSVAGLRAGLDGDRGNLTLQFLSLAHRLRPRWMVWENVPGVLSSGGGRDFGSFLGGLEELGYGWAYRTLDAQYFGVPQRRRRIIAVGYLGDWRPPAAVLFEPHCLSGHPAPRRETGKAVAALTSTGVGTCGVDDNQAQAGHLVSLTCGDRGISVDQACGGMVLPVAPPLTGNPYGDHESREGLLVVGTLQANGKAAGSVTQQDAESGLLVPVAFDTTQITSPYNVSNPKPGDPCHPLAAGGHAPAIAFPMTVHGTQDPDVAVNLAHTLGRNSGQENALCIPLQEVGKRTGASTDDPRAGICIGSNNDPMFTLQAGAQHGVAVALRGRDGGGSIEIGGEQSNALRASQGGGDKAHVFTGAAVRRLTPRECERLQGFPDDYTAVPFGRGISAKKLEEDFLKYLARGNPKGLTREEAAQLAADSPRYRALGNSMAVPVMAWIGRRIKMAEEILVPSTARLSTRLRPVCR